ncbi:MAG: hypothetical protein K9N49_01725 [Candidatus Marinimicrobia bacterium]|nr:hypothetical protein [Candidatus Neomarinimicrobiota bacterium]
MTARGPILRLGAALAAIVLRCAVGAQGAAAGGSWTNLAGRVLKATPKYLRGQAVAFVRDGTDQIVEYPLAIFPPPEQERLRSLLRDTSIPEGLQAAWAFASQHLKRSRLLYESGQISAADYQKSVEDALGAFRFQAAPLIEQQKISPERLELILRDLREGTAVVE